MLAAAKSRLLSDINRGTLGVRSLQLASTSRPIGIITVRKRKLNDGAQAFIAAMRDRTGDIVEGGLTDMIGLPRSDEVVAQK